MTPSVKHHSEAVSQIGYFVDLMNGFSTRSEGSAGGFIISAWEYLK